MATLSCLDFSLSSYPRGYVKRVDNAQVLPSLLAAGDWQTLDGEQAEPVLQLAYPIKNGKLGIEIRNAKLKKQETEPETVTFFAGTLSHLLAGESSEERLAALKGQIDSWHSILRHYEEVINSKFLQVQSSASNIAA